MRMVKMLEDHHGAKKGDAVGFEDDAEAEALVAANKAAPLVRLRNKEDGTLKWVTPEEAAALAPKP